MGPDKLGLESQCHLIWPKYFRNGNLKRGKGWEAGKRIYVRLELARGNSLFFFGLDLG